jgi:RNA polymerase sigma-70 factor (ECF subfamily)
MSNNRFDSLVTAHHEEIYRYLLRVTAQSAAADDLSQETFLRAFRAYSSLPANGNARAWLFTIATNLCRNHLRAEGRCKRAQARMNAGLTGIDNWDPEQALRFNESREALQRALSALPSRQRLAFTLRKFHDLEYEAIGQSLSCSAETARAHVFQALKKIRLALNSNVREKRK